MPKYIDAYDFVEQLFEHCEVAHREKKADIAAVMACVVAPILDGTPNADVEPVRHGRWGLVDRKHTKCSACGITRNTLREIGWNYCPNCGAKMD